MYFSIRMVILLVAGAVVIGAGPQVAWSGKPSGGGGSANYTLVRLTVPYSTTNSTRSYDLNDQANVVGEYRDADNVLQGFYYSDANREYTSLGEPVTAEGIAAQGINNSDNIVGYSLVTYNNGKEDLLIPRRGLYWSSPTAPAQELPPLDGHSHSMAVAMNDSKIIVGASFVPEDPPVTPGLRTIVAWYVGAEGVIQDPVELPFLPGDVAGQASDLNEAIEGIATVVGTSGNALSGDGQVPIPVAWTATIAADGLIVTGPAEFTGDYDSGEARGVNLVDDIVGTADFGNGGRPFIRRAGQSVQPLPLLDRAVSGSASSINNGVRIVGTQWVYQNRISGLIEAHAVLWTSVTATVDLNSQVLLGRGERLWSASDINNNGDILAIINGNQSCLLIAK